MQTSLFREGLGKFKECVDTTHLETEEILQQQQKWVLFLKEYKKFV